MRSFFSAVFFTAFFFQYPVAQTGIQEAKFVTLGGIEQWITICGLQKSSPLLLILHGGPGDAQSCYTDVYAE
jgi:hypothetical protein